MTEHPPLGWRRVRRPLRAFGALTLTTLIALGMPSAAAQQPVPATLTQLAYDGSTLAGVLTVRAISGDVAVDPSSLTVEVAGKSTPASIDSASAMRRAVFLVVDTSGSMTSNAGIPMIKAAVSDFLDRVPADVEVGLVSFSNVAAVDIAPTTDRAAVRSAAGSLEARGETALFDAVALAVDGLGTVGERSILLLSDGVNTAGRRDLGPVLTALQQAGVRLDSIGLRTRVTADDVLKQLASAGGGSFAAATDAAAVTGAFSASATALERQVTWRAPIGAVPIGDLPIQVQGRAGGLPFVAAGTVTVASALTALPTATAATAATPSAPAIAAAVPPATVPRWLLTAGIAGTFLGLMALAAIALTPAFRSHRLERMQTVEAYAARGSVAPLRREAPGLIAANLVDMGDKFMAGRASTSRTMALLQRADLPWRPGEWAMLRVVALCVGGVLGLVLFRDGWIALVGIIVGLLAGLLLPAVGLRFLARRRSTQCERQLPDILMLIASSLSTGFSLPQSLDAVARDVADPAAKEFARVMAETRIGAEIEDALERMALRMDSDNMRWTAMAIRIQRQVGGNLAETLRTAAATLREREYLRRHVRGLSAEGRLSAYLLVALPILLFIYEVNVNRDYISLLWTTTLGWALTAGSVVMMSIGILWMNKAVKVEV